MQDFGKKNEKQNEEVVMSIEFNCATNYTMKRKVPDDTNRQMTNKLVSMSAKNIMKQLAMF